MKNENLISPASPNVLKAFFLAARPWTWSASLSPVAIGTVLAAREGKIAVVILILTVLFALLIQIGTNYANDYFDFLKGVDTAGRQGPKRAVQQGWIAPRQMLIAAAAAFGAACAFAWPLMLSAGLWSFGLAALSVLLGVIYTGGPKPLGYAGHGEWLVFIFFGPVAVLSTYFLQTGRVNLTVGLASLAPGLLSAAILMANNLRDEATDRIAGKRTLVVRFGPSLGRWVYCGCIAGALLVPWGLVLVHFPWTLLTSSLPLLFAPIRKVFLNLEILQETSLLLVFYTLMFCLSVW